MDAFINHFKEIHSKNLEAMFYENLKAIEKFYADQSNLYRNYLLHMESQFQANLLKMRSHVISNLHSQFEDYANLCFKNYLTKNLLANAIYFYLKDNIDQARHLMDDILNYYCLPIEEHINDMLVHAAKSRRFEFINIGIQLAQMQKIFISNSLRMIYDQARLNNDPELAQFVLEKAQDVGILVDRPEPTLQRI
jgi:hypothetical protein